MSLLSLIHSFLHDLRLDLVEDGGRELVRMRALVEVEGVPSPANQRMIEGREKWSQTLSARGKVYETVLVPL